MTPAAAVALIQNPLIDHWECFPHETKRREAHSFTGCIRLSRLLFFSLSLVLLEEPPSAGGARARRPGGWRGVLQIRCINPGFCSPSFFFFFFFCLGWPPPPGLLIPCGGFFRRSIVILRFTRGREPWLCSLGLWCLLPRPPFQRLMYQYIRFVHNASTKWHHWNAFPLLSSWLGLACEEAVPGNGSRAAQCQAAAVARLFVLEEEGGLQHVPPD